MLDLLQKIQPRGSDGCATREARVSGWSASRDKRGRPSILRINEAGAPCYLQDRFEEGEFLGPLEWCRPGTPRDELARAILWDLAGFYFGIQHAPEFADEVLGKLPIDTWQLSRDEVAFWLRVKVDGLPEGGKS